MRKICYSETKVGLIMRNRVAKVVGYFCIFVEINMKHIPEMETSYDPVKLLEEAGIKPTSNRILVLRAILTANSPKSLIELESELQTLERSSVLRVLTLLLEHDLIHTLEDGRGVTKYEVCHGGHHHSGVDDMHAHFYCEKCHKVYCFKEITAPHIDIPETFKVKSINYMLKGICPECRED